MLRTSCRKTSLSSIALLLVADELSSAEEGFLGVFHPEAQNLWGHLLGTVQRKGSECYLRLEAWTFVTGQLQVHLNEEAIRLLHGI